MKRLCLLVAPLALYACHGRSLPDSGGDSAVDTADSSDTAVESGADSGDSGESGDSGDSVDSVDSGDSGESGDTGPAPTDADGDGHAPTEEGGDDCDDADATVYGGAPEWCDSIDHNCDGAALAPGGCSTPLDLDEAVYPTLYQPEDIEYFTSKGLTGDLDANGHNEIYFTCSGPECDPYGSALVYEWPFAPGMAITIPDGVDHTLREDGTMDYLGRFPQPVGDIDGDGGADLMVDVHGGNWGLYVDTGPFPLDGTERSMTDLLRFQTDTYVDTYYDIYWGFDTYAGFDLDSDGCGDFIVDVGPGTNGDWVLGVVYGSAVPGDVVEITDETPEAVLDVDQDGVDDILVAVLTDAYYTAWISGTDLRTADGANGTDLARPLWPLFGESADGSADRLTGDWVALGDWNDDGYGEVAAACVNCRGDGSEFGRVYVFGGEPTTPQTLADAEGYWVIPAGNSRLNEQLWNPDFDGDDRPDLAVYWGSDEKEPGFYRHAVYPAAQGIPAVGTGLDVGGYQFGGADAGLAEVGDMNGDGFDDLIIGSSNFPVGEGVMGYGILFGFDVPWDDPTYW